ncbi:MAG: hypothetical protein Q9M26_04520 [Mariprofundales bacterium]|nr:hypothetical protein [Mariprofundales bacterium]
MSLISFGWVGTAALWVDDAEAIPVFARKYGMSCNSCHTMFPKLTKMGVAFRERGYRFAAGKEDLDMQGGPGKNVDAGDKAVFPSNFPFTVRTQLLFSGSGPITAKDANGTEVPVMPGHRFGMLDGGLTKRSNTNFASNYKIGFGELGLISSGSYNNWFWWLDANTATGIGMLEGGYYVNDLLKVRFGRVQTNVGYGMTMMSQRPLGFGAVDAAQMAGGTMLMMGDGVSIQGTTNGDSGVGTYYNLAAFTYGDNATQGRKSNAYYGRVAQELMDDYIIGIYGYKANNWGSDLMGGESVMRMSMANVAQAMQFNQVARYGVDFALNYGEPLQMWGALTAGHNKTRFSKQNLPMKAVTIAGEWIFTDGMMLGLKYDYSQVDLKMDMAAMATKSVRPSSSSNTTVYGIYQIAENVQGFAAFTQSRHLVTNMGRTGMQTTVDQATFKTAVMGVDLAL